MTVSVAMTSYNGAAFIQCQIDSVLSQLRDGDELVVSDDGSTDGTADILLDISQRDSRVRVLSGPKSGVIANFEYVLGQCKGDWIFLADQDDEWSPDKLQTVLDIAKKHDAILVMHDARIVNTDGRELLPSFFATRSTKTGLLKNLWKNSYIGCCMAFSRRLLPYILPFPADIPMHDQWIGLQAERHGKVALIERPLLSYRRHDRNVTATTHGTVATMLSQRLAMIRALLSRR